MAHINFVSSIRYQVRFKVDKLKQLLADGASEAEVTAAYTEVREDYPGKCEPSAVTAKKWDSTLKAAEVKYPTLAPSADAPAAAPHPVSMGAMAAFIQAETAKVAARAAAEAVDKAIQQLKSANEQATLSLGPSDYYPKYESKYFRFENKPKYVKIL